MPKKVSLPQARLLKVVLEVTMKPDLRRFALLHSAAHDLQGYPEWETNFHFVRVLDRMTHRSIGLSNHELRYICESQSDPAEQDTGVPLPPTLFQALQVPALQRMGHRRWYVAPLEMSYEEAVDLFHLRYYPQDDPMRILGHRIRDVLYRVDTADTDDWRWHVNFAPAPRSQAAQLLQYDFDAHWSPDQAHLGASRLHDRLSEVNLFVDLDCYRDTPDMPVTDWEKFVMRSREKSDQLSKVLLASLSDEEAR